MKQRCTAVRAREKEKTGRVQGEETHTIFCGRKSGEGGAGESMCVETERERQAKIKEMTERAEEGQKGRGYRSRVCVCVCWGQLVGRPRGALSAVLGGRV